jgi:hypothetical protein
MTNLTEEQKDNFKAILTKEFGATAPLSMTGNLTVLMLSMTGIITEPEATALVNSLRTEGALAFVRSITDTHANLETAVQA